MKARLSRNCRKWIRDSERSIADDAKRFGTTWPTARRWKGRRELEDLPRRPRRNKSVSPFEDAIFHEFLKLTRYPYKEVVQYLRPFQAVIRTSIRKDLWGRGKKSIDGDSGQTCLGNWDSKSYYIYLTKERASRSGKDFDKVKPPRFSVATHSLRVRWWNQEGELIKGKLLLFCERNTGYLYAKVYTTRVHSRTFALALFRFNKVLPKDLVSLNFVSSYTPKTPNSRALLLSSVLNLQSAPLALTTTEQADTPALPETPSDLSEESLDMLNRQIAWQTDQEVKLSLDPPTPTQEGYLLIPGTYVSRTELDRVIERIVNLINLKRRSYLYRGRKINVAPLDKFRPMLSTKSRKETAKHYKLPLKAGYVWDA